MTTREQIAYRILNKKYRKIKRDIKLSDFENAKRVGVIWHLDDKSGFRYLSDFLKNKQIIFRNICYSENAGDTIANSFGKKELNFWGFPKKDIAKEFLDIEYDLLFNISVKEHFPLSVITALSNAHFKIGKQPDNQNFYDLSIEIGNNEDSLFLVKQQIHYIEQFNKK